MLTYPEYTVKRLKAAQEALSRAEARQVEAAAELEQLEAEHAAEDLGGFVPDRLRHARHKAHQTTSALDRYREALQAAKARTEAPTLWDDSG